MEVTKLETTEIDVTLEGLADLMFDRFIDHSKEVKPPEQKQYLIDGNLVVMPSENLWSFLFRQKHPVGCIKKFEGKQSGNYLSYGESHLTISPAYIPILHKGQKVIFDGFKDPLYIHSANPVTKSAGGAIIKQETVYRPTLKLPWSISFHLSLVKNDIIDETKLYNYFTKGGLLVALGAYKPRHGRFYVKEWEVKSVT